MGATREHTAIKEHVIKAFGNAAVSTARVLISTKVKGEVQNQLSGQFVHVWAKDQSGWKMVADHFYPYGRIRREKAPPANVEPQVLAAYTGTYRPEVGVDRVAITVEDGTLTPHQSRSARGEGYLPSNNSRDVRASAHELCENRPRSVNPWSRPDSGPASSRIGQKPA